MPSSSGARRARHCCASGTSDLWGVRTMVDRVLAVRMSMCAVLALALVAPLRAQEGKAALPDLVKGLSDKSDVGRGSACQSLEALGPGAASATPSIVKRLTDPDVRVQAMCTRALVAIGSDAGILAVRARLPALTQKLASPVASERARAAFLIGA